MACIACAAKTTKMSAVLQFYSTASLKGEGLNKTGSERESLQFCSWYGDSYSWAPLAALAQTQQLFRTHLEQVGSSCCQPLQLNLGGLKRTQLEEKMYNIYIQILCQHIDFQNATQWVYLNWFKGIFWHFEKQDYDTFVPRVRWCFSLA